MQKEIRMSIRLIHTGDLHIGQRLKKQSRYDEHEKMLLWIHEQVREKQAQLLVIAGDIFDGSSPSPSSMRLFNSFLADLEKIPSLCSVIITAGNHDSAQRLDSFKPVLQRLGIFIVGAYQNRSDDWDSWLIPVYDESKKLLASVAAVPFIHEFRLGLKKNDKTLYAEQIKEAFRDVYGHFAKRSKELYPGAPLIGMGHLTAMSEEEVVGIAPQNVHIALEKGMDGEIFGVDYDYVALGHIHKNYKVRGPANAYYCGSPVPCSIDEAEDSSQRGVWFVDLSQSPVPQLCPAPCFRSFFRIQGTVDELEEKIIALRWPEEQETPFLWLRVETETVRYDLHELFGSLLANHPECPPVIMDIDNVLCDAENQGLHHVDVKTTPQEIFDLLLETKNIPKTSRMQELFSELLAQHSEHAKHEDV